MRRSSLLLGFVSYGVGVAVGLFLTLIAAWADMESGVYGFARLANAGLRGLGCPVLMTPRETGTITLNVSNPTESQISPSIKTLLSTSLSPEEFLENIKLTPGESKTLKWPVDSENIDMGRFIFAKVLMFSAHPLPSRETTCGIFIVTLPGTGQTILLSMVTLSLVGMGWGLYQMDTFRSSNQSLVMYRSPLTFLALLVVLGLVFSFIGGWILSVIILAISLLMIIIVSSSLLMGRSR